MDDVLETVRSEFLRGNPVVILDETREVEGDLVFPAELMGERQVNLFVREGGGLFCVVGPEEELLERGFFRLPTNYGANYFVPVDFGEGTGISASERALTCRKVAERRLTVSSFRYPGHVTLIGAKKLSLRKGHSEASTALVEMCGFSPYSVIVEILNAEGNSHDLEYVRRLAREKNLVLLSVEEVWGLYVRHRQLIRVRARATLPTDFGTFEIVSFENELDFKEHFAVVKDWGAGIPLVRVHSECVTGDCLSSLRCDCGTQLSRALELIGERGGILVYLRQEGRGIGLSEKIRAYQLQDGGLDTYDANVVLGHKPDERDYAAAYQILRALGVEKITLLTNNPDKERQLAEYGIEVVRTERLFGRVTPHNERYLLAKATRLRHRLEELLRGKGGNQS